MWCRGLTSPYARRASSWRPRPSGHRRSLSRSTGHCRATVYRRRPPRAWPAASPSCPSPPSGPRAGPRSSRSTPGRQTRRPTLTTHCRWASDPPSWRCGAWASTPGALAGTRQGPLPGALRRRLFPGRGPTEEAWARRARGSRPTGS